MSPRPPANFIANSAWPRFPELHRDAGRSAGRLARQRRRSRRVAGSSRPCSCARAECFGRAGGARRTGQGRRRRRALLREWFRGFVHKHMGRPLTPRAMRELGPLNALLERDEMFSRIAARPDGDGDRLELQTMRLWRSPESLLMPIGEALARCVCDDDFASHQGVRGTRLHADLRRPDPQAGATVVQHGRVRQSRQTGRPSPAAQG